MKKYLIIGFIFSASCVLSQTEISFDIEGKRVKDAQTFSIGDSLFVALDWFDQSEVLSLKRGYWINTTGQVTAYEFGFVSRLVLCSVERVSDNGHFYYFLDFSKKKKNFTSLGVFFSQSTDLKSVARLNDEIEISGDYIGATSSLEGITLFFFDEENNSIRCLLLSAGKVKHQSLVPMPFKLKSDLVFIGKMKQLSFADGKAKNKIYFESGELILLSDESKDETIVFRTTLDLKKSDSFKIPSDSRNSAIKDNSFLYERAVYKLTVPGKEMKLSVFDLESKRQIYQTDLTKKNDFNQIDIYRQTGFITYKDRSLKSLLSANGTATRFMIVEPFSAQDRSPLIVFGSYMETKGSTPFLLNPYNLASSIAASLLANAIWQAAGKEFGVAKYAYMNGSTTDKLTVVAEFNNPKPTRQIIDDYEIKQGQPKLKYTLKMYQNTANGVLGIYHAKKERKIRIVRF